ncbi:MAG TPA: hypothetical protein VJP07_00665 [Dehalococcoidia bacterium]|nr:hypothetical protein [Dehalococcoidia bacterium]
MGQAAEMTHDTAEQARLRAANMAHETAELLHGHPPGQGRAAEVTERLASRMERTSDYLREADVPSIRSDVRSYVSRHPMQAIAAGVIGGYLFSRVLSH